MFERRSVSKLLSRWMDNMRIELSYQLQSREKEIPEVAFLPYLVLGLCHRSAVCLPSP